MGAHHHSLFQLGPDATPYRKLTSEGVRVEKALGREMLVVEPEALALLAEQAMVDINHLLRPGHLAQLAKILDDPEATDNDKFVAYDLLKNANIAAGGVLPMCQDTGTAIVVAKKGRHVWTDGLDEAAIAQGIREAYRKKNLRYSQVAPLSTFEETNTGDNLPAQIDISAEGDDAYKFLFIAKGGGSANKTFLYQATPSILTHERMIAFLKEKILTLGTAACPPYHLAIVIGGLSAELTLKTVKLASARYLDALPTTGAADGRAFRDLELEAEIQQAHPGARASAPSSAANISATTCGSSACRATAPRCRSGSASPARPTGRRSARSPATACSSRSSSAIRPASCRRSTRPRSAARWSPIDLSRPMNEILAELDQTSDPHPPRADRADDRRPRRGARQNPRTARSRRADAAVPASDHPVYYAGPAKTPEGMASGSFGPTTAGRMDSFVDQFQAAGGSMVMLAKGNRSAEVRKACAKHGGFYLGSIGGPAARLAQDCIRKVEMLEYPELGMEAVWRIEVENFPAFIVIDDKGNDFFKELNLG